MRIAYHSKGKFPMAWLESLTMKRRVHVADFLGKQLADEAKEMEKMMRKYK